MSSMRGTHKWHKLISVEIMYYHPLFPINARISYCVRYLDIKCVNLFVRDFNLRLNWLVTFCAKKPLARTRKKTRIWTTKLFDYSDINILIQNKKQPLQSTLSLHFIYAKKDRFVCAHCAIMQSASLPSKSKTQIIIMHRN